MNLDLTYENLSSIYKKKNYKFFTKGIYNLNYFGVRAENQIVNHFNDVLCVAYNDGYNNIVLVFKATTVPGISYLEKKKLNKNGTAILVPGQTLNAFKLGYHKGYKGLVQNTNEFKVWRDNDQDGQLDLNGPIYKDVTGLNTHTTSFEYVVDEINLYSAGCQVVQYSSDFQIFISIFLKSLDYFKNSFSYTLFEEKDFY